MQIIVNPYFIEVVNTVPLQSIFSMFKSLQHIYILFRPYVDICNPQQSLEE